MIVAHIEATGTLIDKPIEKELYINDDVEAVELENGNKLKVKDLPEDVLEQYIYEKFINNTPLKGRIISLKISRK